MWGTAACERRDSWILYHSARVRSCTASCLLYTSFECLNSVGVAPLRLLRLRLSLTMIDISRVRHTDTPHAVCRIRRETESQSAISCLHSRGPRIIKG